MLKSTHPADRLNWTLESSNLLGTVLLYVDFTAPVEAIRNKLVEIVKGSNLWDGNVVKLQVTDAKEGAMELRAMVSARSAADAFELRCDVREKLIEFLRTEYPTAQPHARAETVASQQARQGREPPIQEQRAPAVEHAEQCQHWSVANALSRRAAGEVHILRLRPP